MDEIKIQVRFSKDGLNDALYFTLDEWAVISQDTLEKLKQERVDKWQEALKNHPIPVEPTKEELLAEKQAIDEQIIQLLERKEDILELTKGGINGNTVL